MRTSFVEHSFKSEAKNMLSFIIFSFLNTFFPIAVCIVSSFINKFGAQAVMAIGYVSPFMLGFMQLSISFGIWTFSILIKRTNFTDNREIDQTEFNKVFSSSIFLSIVMGVILCMFYSLFSSLYMYYSSNRPNTSLTLDYGFNFIETTWLYILLICLKSNLVLYVYYYHRAKATIYEIVFQITSIALSFIFGVVFNGEVIGMGLALSTSMVAYVIFLLMFIKKDCGFKFYRVSLYRFFDSFVQLKNVLSEAVGGLSMALFKGVALVALGLSIPSKMGAFVPLVFQMARVIWFNYMSFLPFMAIGIANAIEYYDLFKPLNPIKPTSFYRKKYWLSMIIAMSFALLLSVSAMYLVRPLTQLYVSQNDFIPSYVPPWGDIPFNSEDLPPNVLPPANVLEIKVDSQTESALGDIKQQYDAAPKKQDGTLSIIGKLQFLKWINSAPGQTALKTVYEGILKAIKPLTSDPVAVDWIKWIVKNPIALGWAIQHPAEFKEWMKNYILYTSLDVDAVVALVNHSVGYSKDSILVDLLHKKIDGRKSNTMIYIIVFSVCSSCYTIMLPATRKLQGRKVYWAIVAVVYFLCIGGVVTLGAIFTWFFSVWAPDLQNPFPFMDAWTFPTMLASIIVATYLLIKFIILCSKDRKRTKKQSLNYL